MLARWRFRGGLVVVLGVLVIAAGVVVLARVAGGSSGPAAAPPFATPMPPPFDFRDVSTRSGSTLDVSRVVGTGAISEKLTLPDATSVEMLSPIALTDIRPGDWVTVIGIPNPVRNFSIHALVVIGSPSAPAEGFVHSALGFSGYEASRDRDDRPVLGGTVASIDSQGIHLATPVGMVALTTGTLVPRVYRLEPSSVAAIPNGARIAGDFRNGTPKAILVLP